MASVNSTKRRRTKALTRQEQVFAYLRSENVGSITAARKAFGWRCESKSREAQRAKDLAKTKRIKRRVEELQSQHTKEAEAEGLVMEGGRKFDWSNIRQFAYDRLIEIRQDPSIPARPRFNAVQALERLSDPSKDINLIYRWIDMIWRYYVAHCPCCHSDIPMWRIKNGRLEDFRAKHELPEDEGVEGLLERRLGLIKEAEKLNAPHPGQIIALATPSRHIVGKGAARAGKSFLLAMFGLLYLMIPGVEIWILARIYDDAKSEFEYIEKFLNTMFYPVSEHMYTITHDKKTGEASIKTRWDTEIIIKSAKSKGSVTGRELEAGLVAEPAWVDGSLYEEIRARMPSRLGRIIALGTPKGFGGFIHRMIKMAGRTSTTGRRMQPEERMVENGCPWITSILDYNISPLDNPTYVKAEQEAAKGELTEAEYASEFLGEMVSSEGAKFPFIKPKHLIILPREQIENCVFIEGVDQGPRNFGAITIGWDGHKLYVISEYLDQSDATTKANMLKLRSEVPVILYRAGGKSVNWRVTIFDADPPVTNILTEMESENNKWPSDTVFRPKNMPGMENWREETTMWINQLSRRDRIWFKDGDCDMIHDQLMEVLIKPAPEGKESVAGTGKGWIVPDMAWRGDHVLDAFMLACHAIRIGQVELPEISPEPGTAMMEAKRGFDYQRAVDEQRELKGWNVEGRVNESDLFREHFGRGRAALGPLIGGAGYFPDES